MGIGSFVGVSCQNCFGGVMEFDVFKTDESFSLRRNIAWLLEGFCPNIDFALLCRADENFKQYSQSNQQGGSQMNYGEALTLLKNGFKVSRTGWNGKDMWLALQTPDSGSKMTLPYIYMKTVDGNLVPWFASQTDMFSSDYVLIKETV